jgi:hypothetical protein
MQPPTNSVNFSGDRVRFEFSERVDRPTLERALTIVPELPTPPIFDWKGRAVEVRFVDSLAESTTYVFTIDNQLRDERGVAISEPIVRAVATGPVIDEGVIAGRLLDAQSSRPVPGIDVVATRIDTAGPAGANATSYRTQSGADGAFTLRYLPEAPFFVRALEDGNRNQFRDSGERVAVPPLPVFQPSLADSSASGLDWWVVNPDTSGPRISSIRARSSSRVEIRFDESIQLDSLDPSAWSLRDTLDGTTRSVQHIYRNPNDKQRLVLVTDSLPEAAYRVDRFGAVSDSAGNAASSRELAFTVAAAADTFRLRFLEFVPAPQAGGLATTLSRGEAPGVRLNQYVSLRDLTSLFSAADTAGTERSFTGATDDGVTWTLTLNPPLQPGEIVRITASPEITPSDTSLSIDYRALEDDELGSFSGHLLSEEEVTIELYLEEGRALDLQTRLRTKGDYVFENLAAGSYKLRLFADRDGDGLWDWGALDPYERPEPMMWYPDSARVRAGWEAVLDTVRIQFPAE